MNENPSIPTERLHFVLMIKELVSYGESRHNSNVLQKEKSTLGIPEAPCCRRQDEKVVTLYISYKKQLKLSLNKNNGKSKDQKKIWRIKRG